MSKRRKRKPTRRERRAGLDRPVKRPADVAAPPEEAPEADTAEEPAPGPSGAAPTVTAVFKPAARSEAAVSLEQEHITRDLRRLGIQMAGFALVIAVLAVLDSRTDLIGNLGDALFRLWE